MSVLYTAAKTLKPSLVLAIFLLFWCAYALHSRLGSHELQYTVVLVFVSAENNVNSANYTRLKASWCVGMFLFTQREQGAVRSRDTPAAVL